MKKHYFLAFVLCMFMQGIYLQALGTDASTKEEGWTIVAIYPVNSNASGLAWDGQYIYIGSYGGNQGANVYRFNPSDGTNQLLFSGPQSQAYGLTFDGEYLWTIDRVSPTSTPAFALKLDLQGNAIEQFNLPSHYMSGIAWDDGDFWVATYFPNPGMIHQMVYDEEEGWSQSSNFVPPQNQPWDLARQGDYLWIAEYNESKLHQVELDGTLVATYPGSNLRTSGVVFDGNFLWYVSRDNLANSFLYKVDLGGSGTPQIGVPGAFNFGNVTTGTSATWNMHVSNTGNGELILESLDFPDPSPFSSPSTFPISIDPGESHILEVIFSPTEIDMYSHIAILNTNDPAALEVAITLSGIGLAAGPYLHTTQELLDYGHARINSSSRKELFLQNMGDADLEISDIQISSPHYWLGLQVSFPITLAPVESVLIPFWYQPTSPGLIEAEASVVFNSQGQSPVTIELTGIADEGEYPLSHKLWQHQFTGSFDFQAKAFLTLPDINGDGINDVIVATRDNRLRAFNGNASNDADILWEKQLGTVEYPKAIALADDINGDGFSDFVVGTAWGDRAVTAISSFTGETLWRFETNIYGNGGWVYMIDIKYDYNGNGYRDVLAATGDDANGFGPKRIFCLNGLTGDIIWQTPVNAAAFAVLAVEDFTGDGVPDVIAGATSPSQQGRVIAINGANGNILWEFTTSGTAVWALEQISDITGNGKPDIIAGSFNGFYYLMDITNGSVVHSGSLGSSLIIDFWKAGDLNGDGYEDIIPAYTSILNAVAISGQNGQLLWTTPLADQSYSVTVLRDITGDGINDIAVGTLFNNNNVYFLDGSDGSILSVVPFASAVDAIGNIPDITGDGSVEVIAGGRNGFLGVYSGGLGLVPQLFDVAFTVKHNGQALEAAIISIQNVATELQTDNQGQATTQLPQGSYSYVVVKEGYFSASGSFEVADQDIQILVEMQIDDTHAPQVAQLVSSRVYPNPFASRVHIELLKSQPGGVTLNIWDTNGRLVYQNRQQTHTGRNIFIWDGKSMSGEDLPDGMYFLEIKTDEESLRTRLMKLQQP
ncbi:MAG: choice-of-anchor D domain-containing protein [Bacteroidales bacterium]